MRHYILPVFIVLLAIVTYKFYIQPLYGDIGRARAKEAEVKSALVETDTAQAKLEEIKKRYESFPPDADERLSQILPEKIDPIRLLIDTTAFLERNGFPAKSIGVSDTRGTEGGTSRAAYQTHTITFSLSGSYDTFREFLHALEASLALRDLVEVSFTTARASSGANDRGRPETAIHEYNIRVTSYSLR